MMRVEKTWEAILYRQLMIKQQQDKLTYIDKVYKSTWFVIPGGMFLIDILLHFLLNSHRELASARRSSPFEQSITQIHKIKGMATDWLRTSK